MQNKPNFQNAQIVVSLVKTMNYNNKQRTMNYSKQSQSNPILFASGGFKRHICSVLGLKCGVFALGKKEKRYLRLPEEDFQGGEV